MGDAAYRQHHRAMGLCVDCCEPAMPYHLRCPKHNGYIGRYCAEHDRTRKMLRVSNGRCYACGREREEGVVGMLCATCRDIYGGRATR